MKDFSIIIPAYNVENYVSAAVQSVLKQNYENLEIILVDDASNDSTGELCEKLAMQDNRIKVLRKDKNEYVGSARNDGLKLAVGRYVYFLDADDEMADGAIAAALPFIKKDYQVISSDRHVTVDGDKTYTSICKGTEPFRTRIATFSPFVGQSFYLREFLEKNNKPFDEHRMLAEDRKWLVENLANAEKMVLVPAPFYLYTRRRAGSLMNTIRASYLAYSLQEMKKLYLTVGEYAYPQDKRLRRKLADHYLTIATCSAIVKDKNIRGELMQTVEGDMAILTGKDCLARPFMWMRHIIGTVNLLKVCNAVFLHYRTDV